MRDRLIVLLIGTLLLTPLALLASERGTPTPATGTPARAAANTPQNSVLHRTLGTTHADAFIDATAALAIYDWADALPERTGRRDVHAACERLDRTQPLERALAATCAPALALGAATARTRHECDDDHRCATIARQRARALRRTAHAERHLARAIRATLPAGPCARALAPPHELVAADLLNADATARYARALDHNDETSGRAASDAMDHAADLAERHAVYPRGRTIARACGLPATTFGNATT